MGTMALPLAGARQLDRSEVYRYRYLIAFAVAMASVLELVDTSIVNVAIPHMMGSLGATLEEIAWVSTGYIVANVIVLPLTSWLSDRFGRRNYYTGSIILFTFASWLCGNASTLEWLVGARVLQGIGGGALISTAQAIIFDVFPLEERATGQAIFGMSVMVGPTLGPTLGGWITDNYSWPWIFYINIPLGIFAALLTWRFVPEPEHQVERVDHVDWLGLALLIVGIGALQVLLERGEAHDWFESREIVTEAVLAVVGLAAFVWHELTTAHPIVDLRILKNRQLTASVVFGAVLGFALYASVFALPVFLQTLLGYTAWDTGKVILPGAIASAVTMAFMGRLAPRVDARLLITLGVLLFMWSMWMHAHFTLDTGMHELLLPMIVRGVAMGLIFVPLTGLAVADLRSSQFAQGTGLFNLSRQLGGSFGIAITATLITRWREQARGGLLPHVTAAEPTARAWLDAVTRLLQTQGGSLAEARQKAYQLLDLNVMRQASVVAFERVFLTMGVTFVLALSLLLLFRTGRMKGSGAAH
ncbi:MAG TPA: DHA2 family efflux MFS transporter permease subunit [Gemmatimonadales bacterium]|nr:DHA2 family efflux MFS transporter permease subunit [Gemmatimonadales bacterium]